MKTSEFLEILKANGGRKLEFEYEKGQKIAAGYHITEVKNVHIDSVDCGAGTDTWKETVVQLWEAGGQPISSETMTAFKALGILQKVARIRPMEGGARIKFEYGNSNFHTAQLDIVEIVDTSESLLLRLGAAKTACKALEACGVPAKTEELAEASCTPGSGCC